MTIRNLLVLVLLGTASTAVAADHSRFSAADVPAAKLKKPGKVVISNDHRSINAWRFFGNVRESLVSLRSTRTFATRAFGSVVYDSGASAAVPSYLASAIAEASRTHGVDARLIAAVAHRESAWKADAVSNRGAGGLMQLMPETARYLGVQNVFDPRENLLGGTRYLRTLLDTFGGDLDLALAAYNAGPGAVQKYQGVPPYRETRAYVAAIRANYEKAIGRAPVR